MRDKKMKILFILGTHRGGGNSQKIEQFVQVHELCNSIDVKYIYLKDKIIYNCNSCYQCSENKECILNDDVKEIVEEMKRSDGIIYVPVVYAFGTNSLFQAFLERAGFGYLSPEGRPLRNKLGSVVVIGRRYAHSEVATQIIMNILLNEMIIIGSGFLPTMMGDTFPGDIESDVEGINAFNKTLSRMVCCYNKIIMEDEESENITNR